MIKAADDKPLCFEIDKMLKKLQITVVPDRCLKRTKLENSELYK